MTFAPFLIANYKTGLDREVEPWLLPADAFVTFINAYIKRGVINKRQGIEVFSRFISAGGMITNITQANPAIVTQVNHGYVDGQEIYISGVAGMTEINDLESLITFIDDDTFSLNSIDSTAFSPYTSGGTSWFFQNLPIMGLKTYLNSSGGKDLMVFNTRRMGIYDRIGPKKYVFSLGGPYDAGTNRFTDYFTGGNSNFFWTENYRSSTTNTDNKLYITNNVDNIYTWDGINYAPFIPQYGSTGSDIVNRCYFIFAFKQRLVLLATEESGNLRPQRARWCQAQNPTLWRDDIPGQGGYVDAPTGDFIVSAAFLKDILVVQFTNSWWTLRPTSDPALPFRWDKITDNRPVNAPYASVSYDKSVTGIGQGGIVECNGVQVDRIDSKIPDFVNDLNQEHFNKCYAARYLQQYQTWTLYPSLENTVSDQILILNEQEGCWSIYDLPLSCLGTVNNDNDPTWQDYQAFPGDPSASLPPLVWVASGIEEDFAEQRWVSGYLQNSYPLFIGGGHDGYIYQLDVGNNDINMPIAMELISANWNPYKDKGIGAQLGYIDFFVDSDPITQIEIQLFVNNETAPYKTQILDFIPQENIVGNILSISNTNPAIVGIHNHNLNTGDKVNLYRIVGMDSLNGGTFTVTTIDNDYFSLDMVDGTALDVYQGAGIAVKGDFLGLKIWKRIFSGSIGYGHSLKIVNYSTDQSIRIHAIMPWFRPAGNRMITL